MNKKRFSNIFILIVIVGVVALIAGYFVLQKGQNVNPPPPKPITTAVQNSVDNKWKTFQNSRFTFQFEYPAEWSALDKLDDPYGVSFWLEEENTASMIMDIETGINLSLIGISYCGAYPQDQRCESLKTESGGYVIIDWDVSGKANAMFSSQDGTYGVSFTLHQVNPETKSAFRKILSTFRSS